jgi:hypothetical protein
VRTTTTTAKKPREQRGYRDETRTIKLQKPQKHPSSGGGPEKTMEKETQKSHIKNDQNQPRPDRILVWWYGDSKIHHVSIDVNNMTIVLLMK